VIGRDGVRALDVPLAVVIAVLVLVWLCVSPPLAVLIGQAIRYGQISDGQHRGRELHRLVPTQGRRRGLAGSGRAT
jgi:hypothetical protein